MSTCKDCTEYKTCTRKDEYVSLMTKVEDCVADYFKCFKGKNGMRRLEMYLTNNQILILRNSGVNFFVTNEVRARRRLVTFDSQEQFSKAYRMII